MEEKTMPKEQRFSLEQIHAVLKKLRSLPTKKVNKTRAEAVECLAGYIRKAVEKGHRLKEIQGILTATFQASFMFSILLPKNEIMNKIILPDD
jgi:hypothetical protein